MPKSHKKPLQSAFNELNINMLPVLGLHALAPKQMVRSLTKLGCTSQHHNDIAAL